MAQDVKFQTAKPNPDNPGVQDIDPKELWEKRQEVQIIDVRRPDEFTGELGHIPGAQLIVLDTLPDHMDQLSKDKTIVFVCKSGGRSGRAVTFAHEEGYQKAFNMKGGMLLWNQLNLEITK